jgi:hypothetical protein
VAAAANPVLGQGQRNQVKDALEAVNDGQATTTCDSLPDDEDEDTGTAPVTGKLTICHIPPGNPAKRHTITQGPCS